MPTYLVRTQELQRLVGMFVAADAAALFNVVDEELDPFACEFVVLDKHGACGLFMDGYCRNTVDEEDPKLKYVAIEEDHDADVTFGKFAIRLSEQIIIDLPTTKKGWKSFTRRDYSRAFGVPMKKLTAEFADLLDEKLDIRLPK